MLWPEASLAKDSSKGEVDIDWRLFLHSPGLLENGTAESKEARNIVYDERAVKIKHIYCSHLGSARTILKAAIREKMSLKRRLKMKIKVAL